MRQVRMKRVRIEDIEREFNQRTSASRQKSTEYAKSKRAARAARPVAAKCPGLGCTAWVSPRWGSDMCDLHRRNRVGDSRTTATAVKDERANR